MDTIKKFEDFINEDLNYEMRSDGCFLTRPWYYYNVDDDIVYGSDKKPPMIENFPIAFGIKPVDIYLDGVLYKKDYYNNDMFLISFDLETNVPSVYTERDEIHRVLKEFGIVVKSKERYELVRFADEIQDAFEKNENIKFMLVVDDQLVASTFDVIEEN